MVYLFRCLAKPIDTIIYATGYKITFPFLSSSIITAADNQVRESIIPPNPASPPGTWSESYVALRPPANPGGRVEIVCRAVSRRLSIGEDAES